MASRHSGTRRRARPRSGTTGDSIPAELAAERRSRAAVTPNALVEGAIYRPTRRNPGRARQRRMRLVLSCGTRTARGALPSCSRGRCGGANLTSSAVWSLAFGLIAILATLVLATGAKKSLAIGIVLVMIPFQVVDTRYGSSSI